MFKSILIWGLLALNCSESFSQQTTKCIWCEGTGKKQEAIGPFNCTNCVNWNESYRSQVPCHVCKNTRLPKYIRYRIVTCFYCKGSGKMKTGNNEKAAKSSQVSIKVEPSKVSLKFTCILKNTFWGDKVQETDDSDHLMYTIADNPGKEFHFYADGKFMYNDVEPYRTNIKGTWKCIGSSDFLVNTEDNSIFDSRVNKWSSKGK